MIKRELAKKYRREQTEGEKFLWEILRNRRLENYKFRRQYVLKGYILDFYCPQKKLCIEADGEHHYTEEGKKTIM